MQASAYQPNPITESLPILQSIGKTDETAVKKCIDTYRNLVWALARKYTDSPEAAEAATLEIFLDIWRYTGRCDPTKFEEAVVISQMSFIRNKSCSGFQS